MLGARRFEGSLDLHVAVTSNEADLEHPIVISWRHEPERRGIGLVVFIRVQHVDALAIGEALHHLFLGDLMLLM
ncbi:hypothetical protein RHOFW104T7_01285 [Rhodanobacter thiooxydans]|uniref:Uncharacterized protein n=1 Tax=Rhodanobacter thiooxydans TaxID=416169 RepID=A0A154QDL2_9GAMM|nr:hypothetical protein RHOFW104T7_01285 [Rhodanobacter thiooxydans]